MDDVDKKQEQGNLIVKKCLQSIRIITKFKYEKH